MRTGFFQIIHELPRNRFLHTPSFLGMKYSDDFIVLEVRVHFRPAERDLLSTGSFLLATIAEVIGFGFVLGFGYTRSRPSAPRISPSAIVPLAQVLHTNSRKSTAAGRFQLSPG